LGASLGVTAPALSQTGIAFATGVTNAIAGLAQTGGSILTSLDAGALGLAASVSAALANLQLAIQAALSASFGVNFG
jgi:hypothetical protein